VTKESVEAFLDSRENKSKIILFEALRSSFISANACHLPNCEFV
jgi:hypothetical protein